MKLNENLFLPAIMNADPHAAIKNFMVCFIGHLGENNALEKELKRELAYFYIDNGPGMGFGEYSPVVTGYYDWEQMDELGIDVFEMHSAYIVSHEKFVDFEVVMYSRREFEGLLTLFLRESYKQYPSWQSKFELIEKEFYDRDAVFAELVEKLDGINPWEHGPLSVSQEKVRQWHAFHTLGYAKKIQSAGAG